jgi:dihydropteroate synthase
VIKARSTPSSPDPAGTPARPATGLLARLLGFDRPVIMGVVNVTPDSFSDGGRFLEPQRAIEHARRLAVEGADILDIGAESTRPYGGMVAVSPEEELRRLTPVLPEVTALGVPVSIDTLKASVASAALAAGASIVNDVWGLQRDPDMARVVAEHAVPVIIMHNRDAADPAIDIMADIAEFFTRSLDIAQRAGIARDTIVLDPGIGFGKTPHQSITAIARLGELRSLGLPLLIGASRKRFIDWISPAPPDQRIGGSIVSHLVAVENGAAIVRTHDVAETVQALRVAQAIREVR